MEKINFVDLRDELTKNDIEWDRPTCCNSKESNYSLLRVQTQASVLFNQAGVWIEAIEHDEKCLSLLRMAKQRNCDLVLFPEYCISYPVLEQITRDGRLWPENKKLWVLPCQGIPIKKFEDFISQISSNENVFVLDSAWDSRAINKKHFVTALFYCFLGYRNDKKILCLVPQLKTQPMGDQDCLCEQSGMSTGGVIFILENCLLTLLCADSMNNDITWEVFQRNDLQMPEFTILHPQLNSHPKDEVFSRLRRDMFDHSERGNYITCNWSKGTALYQKSNLDKPIESISISWSCIYRKHKEDIFEKWREKDSLRQKNGKCGLWGAMMRQKRTEVWFSLNYEEALEVIIPMLSYDGYGKTQISDICAQVRFQYDQDAKNWVEREYKFESLQQRIDAQSEDEELRKYSKEVKQPYRFPLDTLKKDESDLFFSLALAGFHRDILEIDENENLVAWTLLLDESELKMADTALYRLWNLIHVFSEDLPPQCTILKGNHKFCYQPAINNKPSINFEAGEDVALVAYAETESDAREYIRFLKRKECNDDEDLLRRYVRVFSHEPIERKLICEPPISTDITQGNAILMKGDITDGGTELDP